MRHHAFAAVMGILAAASLVSATQSQAATTDPTGYWYKPDAERESKLQVFKCGRSALCAKIIWLKQPNDSRGRPLHDVRNEDPSRRSRPIVGLTLFNGMTPSGPGTWTGQIYNPEDGHTYAATLTLVSQKQIVLKGCKAWLLCGEKIWLRTSPPPQPEPAEPQIEASAKPDAAPVATAEAEAKPAPQPIEASLVPEPHLLAKSEPEPAAAPQPEAAETKAAEPAPRQDVALVTPAPTPAEQDVHAGVAFLNAEAGPETAARFSGEQVSSLFVMTEPIAGNSVAKPSDAALPATEPSVQPAETAALPADAASPQAAVAEANAVPLPDPKPSRGSVQATAAATPKPATAAPVPHEEMQSAQPMQAAEADAAVAETPPLTWRERRLLRRQMHNQQGPLLPWLH